MWGDDYTIWDRIDFEDIGPRGWSYEDHADASVERALGTELCRRIPYGWATEFGQLFKAYAFIVRHEGLAYECPDNRWGPKWFGAILVDDYRAFQAGRITEWSVPWHRMRDRYRRCRTPRHPPGESAVVRSNHDQGNTRWVEEGRKMWSDSGQVEPAHMFDIDAAVRRGLITLEFAEEG